MIKRIASSILSACLGMAALARGAGARPNILMIALDDLRPQLLPFPCGELLAATKRNIIMESPGNARIYGLIR